MTMAVFLVLGSVVAAAFPGPLFALRSEPGALGSAGNRLRLRCLGGNFPSAPIVVCAAGVVAGRRQVSPTGGREIGCICGSNFSGWKG